MFRWTFALLLAVGLSAAPARADLITFNVSFTGTITGGAESFDGVDGSGNPRNEYVNLTGHAAFVNFYYSYDDSGFDLPVGGVTIIDLVTGITVSSFSEVGFPAFGSYLDNTPGAGPDSAGVSLDVTRVKASNSGSASVDDPLGRFFETGKREGVMFGATAEAVQSSPEGAYRVSMTVQAFGVPEPSLMVMGAAGLLGVAGLRRRFGKAST